MRRVLAKYAKEPPHGQVGEHVVEFSPAEVKHLFDLSDDPGMEYVYQIRTEKQREFFGKFGVPLDQSVFWFVESYEVGADT